MVVFKRTEEEGITSLAIDQWERLLVIGSEYLLSKSIVGGYCHDTHKALVKPRSRSTNSTVRN